MSTVHQAYFDAKAAIWDTLGDPATGERLRAIVGELAIQPGARVLDVGTGTGVLVPLLVPAVGPAGRVVALDLAGEMLKKAREKFPVRQVEFVQGDIIRPPFPAASFDEIICNACFPHLQDKPRAVRQMAALLKPGGRLVVCHASSREALNQMHHSIGGVVGSDLLPEAPVMHQLFAVAGLTEIKITDTPDKYIVTARKPVAGSAVPGEPAEMPAVLAAFTPPMATGSLAMVFRGFQEALLVYESLRLGIFTVLADQNRTLEEVAAGTGGKADRLVYVLDALTAIGLVEKEAAVYRNSPEARTYLWPGSKFY
ncbi:MAG: methyltransferase domain-containing protein, partial [Heliobacteriaceae bacterium]|nr:methyltransferase domain-containing protein [Heliobacteriaceae bacterium]